MVKVIDLSWVTFFIFVMTYVNRCRVFGKHTYSVNRYSLCRVFYVLL